MNRMKSAMGGKPKGYDALDNLDAPLVEDSDNYEGDNSARGEIVHLMPYLFMILIRCLIS